MTSAGSGAPPPNARKRPGPHGRGGPNQPGKRVRHGSYARYYERRLNGQDATSDERLPHVLRAIASVDAPRPVLLDIGCNDGALTAAIAATSRVGFAVGVDIDAALIAKATAAMGRRIAALSTAAASAAPASTPDSSTTPTPAAPPTAPTSAAPTYIAPASTLAADRQGQHPIADDDFTPLSCKVVQGALNTSEKELGLLAGPSLPATNPSTAKRIGTELKSVEPSTTDVSVDVSPTVNPSLATLLAPNQSGSDSSPAACPPGATLAAEAEDIAVRRLRTEGFSRTEREKNATRDDKFPFNITFRSENFVDAHPGLVAGMQESFDVVLCLSVTKWVHMHGGDEALKLLFKRMHNALKPGGVMVLEPQPQLSYKRARRKNLPGAHLTFRELQLRPNKFKDYLLGPEIGFTSMQMLREVAEGKGKAFNRPIMAFYKTKAGAEAPQTTEAAGEQGRGGAIKDANDRVAGGAEDKPAS